MLWLIVWVFECRFCFLLILCYIVWAVSRVHHTEFLFGTFYTVNFMRKFYVMLSCRMSYCRICCVHTFGCCCCSSLNRPTLVIFVCALRSDVCIWNETLIIHTITKSTKCDDDDEFEIGMKKKINESKKKVKRRW